MEAVAAEIIAEAKRAEAKYGPPASMQESLGVLLEEFEELREAIHANKRGSVELEAIQVAAVALRLAMACRDIGTLFYQRSGFRS